ncbi:N-acetyltransferase [Micromonospora sp. CA-263727]|uniref:N-acetyltransferase n=1 Tax=Micromonospora sp. CA-263727 TaxID=3239967 RepID=UPI003D8B9DC0
MGPIDPAARRATGQDLPALTALLTGTWQAGRIGAWLVPDTTHRRRLLHTYARLVLAHAMAHGRIDTSEDGTAVAVWYPRLRPPPPCATLVFGLYRSLGPHATRFALLHHWTDALHPHTPHHYLAHTAGDQDAVGVLLAAQHRALDPHRLPSYAELVTDRPRAGLLARLGYAPRTPVRLAPGGPVLWRMVRTPPGGRSPDELPDGGMPRRVRAHRIPVRRPVLPAAARPP